MFYFRYVVNGEICWFYVGNPEPRKGIYYTAIQDVLIKLPPSHDECDDLNNLYKVLNRDDKLKELGI